MSNRKYDVFKDGKLIDKDDDPILRDGEVMRVNMMMMDNRTIDPVAYKHFYDNLPDKSKLANAEVIAAAMTHVTDAAHHRPHFVAFGDTEKNNIEAGVQAYRKRVGDAWRQNPPAIADASKLGCFIHAMGAQTAEIGFKTATAAGEPLPLEQARARRNEKLRNAWRNPF